MGAFRWPPVDNLLRALPVLDVTDNRRLTLWVVVCTRAAGRDRPRSARANHSRLARCWLVALGRCGALLFGLVGLRDPLVRGRLRQRGHRSLSPGGGDDAGADPAAYRTASRAPGAAGARVSAALLWRWWPSSWSCWPRSRRPLRRAGRCSVWLRPGAARRSTLSIWPGWASA